MVRWVLLGLVVVITSLVNTVPSVGACSLVTSSDDLAEAVGGADAAIRGRLLERKRAEQGWLLRIEVAEVIKGQAPDIVTAAASRRRGEDCGLFFFDSDPQMGVDRVFLLDIDGRTNLARAEPRDVAELSELPATARLPLPGADLFGVSSPDVIPGPAWVPEPIARLPWEWILVGLAAVALTLSAVRPLLRWTE